jgi:hypothetical protein
MKCLICPPTNCFVENEADGIKLRVDAHVINGTELLASLNTEIIVGFVASSVQMTTAVKTKVQAEFLRLFNISVALNDIVVVGGGIA